MNNCTAVAQLPEPFDPATDITIQIVRADECPNGNLPSTFFPGAGSDGALFQVIDLDCAFPSESDVCLALSREDSDNCLSWYDEKTGRGYYRICDSYAPAQGTVITLPGLYESGADNWDDWDEPCAWHEESSSHQQVDPVRQRIDQLHWKALNEIAQMAESALRYVESITLSNNLQRP